MAANNLYLYYTGLPPSISFPIRVVYNLVQVCQEIDKNEKKRKELMNTYISITSHLICRTCIFERETSEQSQLNKHSITII